MSFEATVASIIDEVDEGNLGDPSAIIYFTIDVLRKHKLYCGHLCKIQYENNITWAKIEAIFDTPTNKDHLYCKISKLLACNLDIQQNQTLTLHLPCKSIDDIKECKHVILKEFYGCDFKEIEYKSAFMKEVIDMMKLNTPFIHIGCILSIYICEKNFQFKVINIDKVDQNNEEPFKISSKTQIKIREKQIEDIKPVHQIRLEDIKQRTLEWIKNVEKEFIGYSSLVQDLIQTMSISQYSHFISQNGSDMNNISKYGSVHGILIHGESGSGKTKLIQTIMKYSGWKYKIINGSDIYRPNVGETEKQLYNLFAESMQMSNDDEFRTNVIIIDDLHEIATDVRTQTRVEKQVFSELIHCFDKITKYKPIYILVIGLTNRVEFIEGALRRVGRFEREYEITVPTPEMRSQILSSLMKNVPIDESIHLKDLIKYLSENAVGFVAADLIKLIREAAMICISKKRVSISITFNELKTVINKSNFEEALDTVKPSLLKKQSHSNITFSDLNGIDDILKQLKISVIYPLIHIDKYRNLGIAPPRGILLYGPPGVGKTSLAYAIANEANANFVSVQCPDIISKIVGASSRAVSKLFQQARASSPCVLFFDQFESLARSRGCDTSNSQAADRVLSTLLTEMDGIANKEKSQVIVLAATSRIDLLDPAILRPGRIDQHIHIPLPNMEARLSILRNKCKKMPLSNDVVLEDLASVTEGCSGADLENICREAAMICLREDINNREILAKHFEMAKDIILKEKMRN